MNPHFTDRDGFTVVCHRKGTGSPARKSPIRNSPRRNSPLGGNASRRGPGGNIIGNKGRGRKITNITGGSRKGSNNKGVNNKIANQKRPGQENYKPMIANSKNTSRENAIPKKTNQKKNIQGKPNLKKQKDKKAFVNEKVDRDSNVKSQNNRKLKDAKPIVEDQGPHPTSKTSTKSPRSRARRAAKAMKQVGDTPRKQGTTSKKVIQELKAASPTKSTEASPGINDDVCANASSKSVSAPHPVAKEVKSTNATKSTTTGEQFIEKAALKPSLKASAAASQDPNTSKVDMSPKVREKTTDNRAGNTGEGAGVPQAKKISPSNLCYKSGRPLSYVAVLKGSINPDDDEAGPEDNTPKQTHTEKMKMSTPVMKILKAPSTARSKAKGGRNRSSNKKSVPLQPKTAIQTEKSPNRNTGDGNDSDPVPLAPENKHPVSSPANNMVKVVKTVRKRGKRGGKKNRNKSVTSPLSVTKAQILREKGSAAVEDAVPPEIPTATKDQELLKSSSLIRKSDSVKPSDASPTSEADAYGIPERAQLSPVKEYPPPAKEDSFPGEQNVPVEPSTPDSGPYPPSIACVSSPPFPVCLLPVTPGFISTSLVPGEPLPRDLQWWPERQTHVIVYGGWFLPAMYLRTVGYEYSASTFYEYYLTPFGPFVVLCANYCLPDLWGSPFTAGYMRSVVVYRRATILPEREDSEHQV